MIDSQQWEGGMMIEWAGNALGSLQVVSDDEEEQLRDGGCGGGGHKSKPELESENLTCTERNQSK